MEYKLMKRELDELYNGRWVPWGIQVCFCFETRLDYLQDAEEPSSYYHLLLQLNLDISLWSSLPSLFPIFLKNCKGSSMEIDPEIIAHIYIYRKRLIEWKSEGGQEGLGKNEQRNSPKCSVMTAIWRIDVPSLLWSCSFLTSWLSLSTSCARSLNILIFPNRTARKRGVSPRMLRLVSNLRCFAIITVATWVRLLLVAASWSTVFPTSFLSLVRRRLGLLGNSWTNSSARWGCLE